MRRYENHVPILKPNIPARVSAEQVIIKVQGVDYLPPAPNGYASKRARFCGTPSCIERRQNCACARNAIARRMLYIAQYEDLIASEPRWTNRELRRSTVATTHSRIDSSETRVQNLSNLSQSEVRDRDLADLWNYHEPFTGDVEGIRVLDIPCQHQHQLVAWPDAIVVIDGASKIWFKLRSRAPKNVETEDIVS